MSKWATRSWPRFRKAGARPYRAAGYHRCCELGGGCRGGGWGLWEAHDALQHRGHHPRRDDPGRDARRLEQDDRGQPDCAFPGPEDGCAGNCEVGKRSEEHTSELQSLMRISYAVFCLKKKNKKKKSTTDTTKIQKKTYNMQIQNYQPE